MSALLERRDFKSQQVAGILSAFALMCVTDASLGPLRAQSPNSWSLGTPMPTARNNPFMGVVGNKIYVIGGQTTAQASLNVVEIYDTVANSWSTGTPMPTSRENGASAVVNNILYAIGGQDSNGPLKVVEVYDPVADTWSTKASIPTATDSMYAIAGNNVIYVIGGFNPGSGRLTSVMSYNPTNNVWSTSSPLQVAKSNSALGLIGSVIVSADGLANSGVTTDTEGLSLASNSWAHLAPAPTARNVPCYGTLGGSLYLAGGNAVGNASQLSSMDAYNAGTNAWTSALPTMPHAVEAAGSATAGGKLYCFGGTTAGSGSSNAKWYDYVHVYEPAAVAAETPTNVLPQLAFGGGWYTALYFTNLTANTVSFPVSFVAGDGTPLTIPALGASSVTMTVDARGTTIIEAPNTGSLVEGYATAALPAGVTGYGVFRYTAAGSAAGQEAVVPLSGVTATTSTMIFDETSYTTGVAVVGLGPAAVTVNVTAYDQQGNTLGTGSIRLVANGKTAVLLRDIPGLAGVAGQLGSADFSVSSGNVAVLGIRTNGLAFTSIPTSDR